MMERKNKKMSDDVLRMKEPWVTGHPEEGILYIDEIVCWWILC